MAHRQPDRRNRRPERARPAAEPASTSGDDRDGRATVTYGILDLLNSAGSALILIGLGPFITAGLDPAGARRSVQLSAAFSSSACPNCSRSAPAREDCGTAPETHQAIRDERHRADRERGDH